MRSSLCGGQWTLDIYLPHTARTVLLSVNAERMCRSGILKFLLTENIKHSIFKQLFGQLLLELSLD
jgi:hypothetical protein